MAAVPCRRRGHSFLTFGVGSRWGMIGRALSNRKVIPDEGQNPQETRRQIKGEEEIAQTRTAAHRTLLLANAEWLEGQHDAGGMQASLCPHAGEHRQRRAVPARLPQNLAQ